MSLTQARDDLLDAAEHALGAAHLAADDDPVGGGEGLAGDPRLGVLGQEGVEHGVRDAVADLVGMPLGDGFRGEEIVARDRSSEIRPSLPDGHPYAGRRRWSTGDAPGLGPRRPGVVGGSERTSASTEARVSLSWMRAEGLVQRDELVAPGGAVGDRFRSGRRRGCRSPRRSGWAARRGRPRSGRAGRRRCGCVPFSYFWICEKVRPRWRPSRPWLMPSASRRLRIRRPTCTSISFADIATGNTHPTHRSRPLRGTVATPRRYQAAGPPGRLRSVYRGSSRENCHRKRLKQLILKGIASQLKRVDRRYAHRE